MKRTRLHSVLTFALLGATAAARTLPVARDSYGSPVTQVIAKASGRAASLPVSAKSEAYFYFNVAGANLPAENITAARLIIYCPKVTKNGQLALKVLGDGFLETFPTKTAARPPSVATLGTFDVAVSDPKRFYILPVTDIVREWAAGTAVEFGFCIASDGLASATIAAKESVASGHPAVLEVDVNAADGAATFSSIASGTGAFSGAMTGATASFSTSVTSPVGSFTAVSGGTGSFTGNVGIGLSATTSPLTVQQNQAGEVLAFKKTAGANAWHLTLDNGALNFFVTGTVDSRLTIEPGGNMGVGTNAPGAKLDVRGDIKLGPNGQYFAPGSPENLRIVRGSVNFDGTALRGAGYTVSRKAGSPVGVYKVELSTIFPDFPTVVASLPAGTGGFTVSVIPLTFFSFEVRTFNGAAPVDALFDFIVAGPK